MIEFSPVIPHWRLKGKFVYSFVMKFNFQYWESVQFFLSFRSRVANLVSVSILVFNCTELPFERCTVKWSQLSFHLSFPIGNSKFNPKSKKKNYSKSQCCRKLQFKSWFNNTKLARQDIFNLFAGQKAVSFTISVCNPIFLIAKIKLIQFPDYSFCCRDICRNIQVQEKNCLKS